MDEIKSFLTDFKNIDSNDSHAAILSLALSSKYDDDILRIFDKFLSESRNDYTVAAAINAVFRIWGLSSPPWRERLRKIAESVKSDVYSDTLIAVVSSLMLMDVRSIDEIDIKLKSRILRDILMYGDAATINTVSGIILNNESGHLDVDLSENSDVNRLIICKYIENTR